MTTTFRSRWLDWESSQTLVCVTDKTAKSPSVSFVSTTDGRLRPENDENHVLSGQADLPVNNNPWEAETNKLIAWFLAETAPTEPFELQPGVFIATPGPWWQSIRNDIAAGQSGARWRAVPHDLKKLHALFGPDIEREGIVSEEFYPD